MKCLQFYLKSIFCDIVVNCLTTMIIIFLLINIYLSFTVLKLNFCSTYIRWLLSIYSIVHIHSNDIVKKCYLIFVASLLVTIFMLNPIVSLFLSILYIMRKDHYKAFYVKRVLVIPNVNLAKRKKTFHQKFSR